MAIDYDKDGNVATIRINRPDKLNALTLAMYDDLGRAFADANADNGVYAVVLTGAGDRAFCVGADLTESIPALAEGRFDISHWDSAHLKVGGFYKPVVSAIRGHCLGGGFEIMLATDIRIAAKDAQFQLPEAGHGFVPAGGTLVRLVRQIGYAHAMEIMITGEKFSATDMLARGVVNRIVEAAEVEATAQGLAARVAKLSPSAVQTIKEAALTLQHLPLAEAFHKEAALGQRTFTSEDARRGLAAFAERGKRK
ncbi:enoyl-CoA hydratase/isomerase family protein [Agrobacterium vitis]|uniref:enoyl-CoA hydratase/isomerase family protein n=1 Tax=Agrobacterium vitis TaxID=373 RepID=UPI0012E829D3|nr:enoyl-CoA hydratase/isomerase family protein [Agrobacterium vitis]MVA37136.1 enoyl-CoA hydratase/isomerase family protein [Agrobacterium vitis]